jgi:D-arginine dehydrogenase
LSAASLTFLENPPEGLADHPWLTPRGGLVIAREDQLSGLDEWLTADPTLEYADAARVRELAPVLRDGYAAGGVWEAGAMDIDVAGVHQGFVRGLRGNGGRILTNARVNALAPGNRGWLVEAGEHRITAPWVVDAAGAWGDEVARLAGIEPVGLMPRRRTAFMVGGSRELSHLPFVVDVNQDFYFKADGVQILCSLGDETPSEPCDAKPEQLDVALAIERINAATTLAISHVKSEWAGLRTFAPDDGMVIGPGAEGFVWLVGQGGTGIQTAPGAGMVTAALITGRDPEIENLDLALLAADRFTVA